MLKAVIFDMDGVILNSEPIYHEVNLKMFKDYGLDVEEVKPVQYQGVNLLDMWRDITNNYKLNKPIEPDEIAQDNLNHFLLALKNKKNLKLMNGIEEGFQFFKDKKIKMIIASSSYPEIIDYIYHKLKLYYYIEQYVDINKIENGKPDPDIFLTAAKTLNVSPEECLVIEDSTHGITAAHRADIKSVAYKQSGQKKQDFSQADLIIDKFNYQNLKRVLKLF
jgi:HAD superfamily hydrolase (TIGR01509 family)